MNEKRFLICAPANAELTVPGSRFDKCCSACGSLVMIAPSGQGVLASYPDTVILCGSCYSPLPDDSSERAASIKQMAQEVASAYPNPRRWRN